MPVVVLFHMAVCKSCGFQFVTEGKACPACGSVEQAVTIFQQTRPSVEIVEPSRTPTPSSSTPSSATPSSATPSKLGGRRSIPKGTVIDEKYEIQDFIGRGGMGSVYRVLDKKENRKAALKLLHQAMADEEGGEQRFMREIETLSKIKHPGVLALYGWGRYEEQLYFVSEFVSGRDLKSDVKTRGPWPAEEVAKLGATLADALAVAHSKGVVHRDIKPHNIMISNEGTVRLLDFGVARTTGGGMETLTKTGMIVGTPEYMSPEQFGTHRVDQRSDLYSLGVVMFELLTGKIPFEGETPVAIALKVIQQPPPTPQSVRKDVPDWIDRIVSKCLQKDPNQRYANASQLAEDLRKPHSKVRPTMKWLPNGDSVVQDTSGEAKYALILTSPGEKPRWTESMALRFSDQFFKLQEIVAPTSKTGRWYYNFSKWPDEEILRGLIDYDQHASEKPAGKPSFFKKLLGKG